MGYSADLIQGTPIVIERPDLVLLQLLETQKSENSYNGQGGHLSWCHPVETYLANGRVIYTDLNEAAAEALQELLTDYGFAGVTHKNGVVTIDSWGGDKLGSSWDTIWQALGQGYTETHPVAWIMCGEDLEYWCQLIQHGSAQELKVDVSFNYGVPA